MRTFFWNAFGHFPFQPSDSPVRPEKKNDYADPDD
jgi:hypothetical protein